MEPAFKAAKALFLKVMEVSYEYDDWIIIHL